MKTASKLTKEALENREKISALYKVIEDSRNKHRDDSRHLRYEVYQPQLREIERQRDEALDALDAQQKADQADLSSQITGLKTVIDSVLRILLFLRLKPRVLSVDDDVVKFYRGEERKYKEALPYLFDDDYLKVKLFIAENNKPKNKYSLCAVGDTIFPESLLKHKRDYGCPFHTERGFAIETYIRDAASVEDLKAWLSHHYFTLHSDLVGDYLAVKTEYLLTIQNYKVADFALLLLATCHNCGYFYTIFDDIGRVNGVINCPHCGSNMNRKGENE
jgi:hypothetical protein